MSVDVGDMKVSRVMEIDNIVHVLVILAMGVDENRHILIMRNGHFVDGVG